jgi:multidrug efflux pump subunit AcrB
MHQTIQYFVKNYRFTFLITLLFIMTGFRAFMSIQRESRPPVDFAIVKIVTVYPGSSPIEVQEKITDKIEERIKSVSGLKDIQSISQAGLSTVSIRIDMDNYVVKEVIEDIETELQRVQGLPGDLPDPPLLSEIKATEIPILQVAIQGPNDERRRDRFADQLKDILEDDEGVSKVLLSGYVERQFQVLLHPEKLERFQVGSGEVVAALQRHNLNIPAGYIQSPTERMMVRVDTQARKAEQLNDIVVRSNFDGVLIRVQDVATVTDGSEDPSSLAEVNGKPATILTIYKKEDKDAIKAVERLLSTVESFKVRLTPEFSLLSYNNESERVKERLSIVIENAVSGFVLVVVVLLLFLPGMSGVMAALSLPLGIAGTLALMPALGANINNVTLACFVIVIGMLVDNAIVISENYSRHRAEGMDPVAAATKAAHQFWLPITATVLTTVAAFLPMLVTKGIMGQFIKWIPIVVSISLLVSLWEGFFLLPARLQFTSRGKGSELGVKKKRSAFDWLRDKFELFVLGTIRWRYVSLMAITLTLGASLLLAVKGNRFEIFPKEDIEFYYVRYQAPSTTGLVAMGVYSQDLATQIRGVLGEDNVRYLVAQNGLQRFGLTDPQEKNGEYVGMITIAIPPEKAKDLKVQDVLARLRSIKVGGLESLTFEPGSAGPPVGTALNITLRSNNYEELAKVRDMFVSRLGQVEGTADIGDNETIGAPEYQVIPNVARMAMTGVDVQSLGFALRTVLQGALISEQTDSGETFELRVRFGTDRDSIKAVENLRIMNPRGNLVPLSKIADIQIAPGPAVRRNFDYQRAITVSADVNPTILTSVELNALATKILDEILADQDLVTYTIGGEQEATKESVQSLFSAMIIAIFAIFLILLFLFPSYLQALLVLSSIPLGLVGVSLAFYLHDKPISFFALIGVIGLAGVVVNSAIILMSYIAELRAEENMDLAKLLAKASALRLRAVLATSITTVFGLLPTAYGIGGYDTNLVPMTLALAWGLAGGTALTLIWIPVGYAIIEDFAALGRRLFRRGNASLAAGQQKQIASLANVFLVGLCLSLVSTRAQAQSESEQELILSPATIVDLVIKQSPKVALSELQAQKAEVASMRVDGQYDTVIQSNLTGSLDKAESLQNPQFIPRRLTQWQSGVSRSFDNGWSGSLDVNLGYLDTEKTIPMLPYEPDNFLISSGITLKKQLLRNADGALDRLRRQDAELARDLANLQRDEQLEAHVLEALQVYWGAVLSKVELENSTRISGQFMELVRQVQNRRQYNLTNPGELQKVRAEAESYKLNKMKAQHDLDRQVMRLRHLLGLPPQLAINIEQGGEEDRSIPEPIADLMSLRAMRVLQGLEESANLSKTLATEESREQLELLLRAASTGVDSAFGESLNEFGSGARPTYMAGVQWLSPWSKLQSKANLFEKTLEANIKKQEIAVLRLNLESSMTESYMNLQEIGDRMDSLKIIEQETQKAIDDQRIGYSQGRVQLTELIRNYNDLTRWKLQVAVSRAQHHLVKTGLLGMQDRLLPAGAGD